MSVADGAGGVLSRAHITPPTFSLVVPYLRRPDADARLRAFLEGVSQGLYTALVPFAIWRSGSMLLSTWLWSGK